MSYKLNSLLFFLLQLKSMVRDVSLTTPHVTIVKIFTILSKIYRDSKKGISKSMTYLALTGPDCILLLY